MFKELFIERFEERFEESFADYSNNKIEFRSIPKGIKNLKGTKLDGKNTFLIEFNYKGEKYISHVNNKIFDVNLDINGTNWFLDFGKSKSTIEDTLKEMIKIIDYKIK